MSRENMSYRNPSLMGRLYESQDLYAHAVTTQLELNGMPHLLLSADRRLELICNIYHICASLDPNSRPQNS